MKSSAIIAISVVHNLAQSLIKKTTCNWKSSILVICSYLELYSLHMLLNPAASAWFAIGADLDLSQEDGQEAKKFQNAMQDAMTALLEFAEAMPIYKIYPTPLYKKIKRAVLAVQTVGKQYMEQNRQNIEKRVREGGSMEGLSLIEQWMIEGKMSEEQCIMSAVSMFAAGLDTVSLYMSGSAYLKGTTIWCILVLNMYKHIYKFGLLFLVSFACIQFYDEGIICQSGQSFGNGIHRFYCLNINYNIIHICMCASVPHNRAENCVNAA